MLFQVKQLIKRTVNRALLSLPFPPEWTGAPPRGFVPARLLAEEGQGGYTAVHARQTIERRAPRIVESGLHWKFSQLLEEETSETFVCTIPGGRVWGRNGSIITPDNRLVWDLSREFGTSAVEGHSVFHQLRLKPSIYLEGKVAVLGTEGTSIYYHWLCDVLPRLHLLRHFHSLESIDYFILDYHRLPFQVETLARFGIHEDRIVASTNHWDFHIKASELIIPSLPSRLGSVAPWAGTFIRHAFEDALWSGSLRRRLYVSRRHARGRRMLNEAEVVGYLHRHGFETVHLEEMPVVEQARLFSEAEYVIAPHGSGLTNIIFCQSGSKILDIFAPGWVTPCFWTASEALGLNYGYLIGTGERPADGVDPVQKGADIKVDLDELDRMLQFSP